MMELNIPGRGTIKIQNLVFDLNGTLAIDGHLSSFVQHKLQELIKQYDVYVISADTYDNMAQLFAGLDIHCIKTSSNVCGDEKVRFILELDADHTIAIGNGVNDARMLKAAAIGIAIVGEEGCSRDALASCDLAVSSIDHALECLLKPMRLIATLRE